MHSPPLLVVWKSLFMLQLLSILFIHMLRCVFRTLSVQRRFCALHVRPVLQYSTSLQTVFYLQRLVSRVGRKIPCWMWKMSLPNLPTVTVRRNVSQSNWSLKLVDEACSYKFTEWDRSADTVNEGHQLLVTSCMILLLTQ